VSVPFHSPALAGAVPLICSDAKRLGIQISPDDLLLPVYSTVDGSNLQHFPACDLVPILIGMQCTEPVNWPLALLAGNATHILDFGPGQQSGIGRLSQRLLDGRGVQVIHMGVSETSDDRFPGRDRLLSSHDTSPTNNDLRKVTNLPVT
jgi:malonyl CoA-acyl carrier protein transacylase